MEQRPRDELHAQLEALPSNDLADMIIELLNEEPQATSTVEAMLAARSVASSDQVDRATLRKQAQRVVDSADDELMPWDSEKCIAELTKIESLGNRHHTQAAFEKASPIYGALIDAMLDNHEALDDDCTPFSDFLAQLTDKQVDCFRHLAVGPARHDALADLWRIWCHDADIGGSLEYDFLWDLFLEETSLAEKQWLASQAKSLVEPKWPYPDRPAALWLDLAGDALSEEEFADRCGPSGIDDSVIDELFASRSVVT
ncbi:MAG: hypothetical protein ACLFVJ_14570 [Persicimonas sp.]